MTSLNIIEIFRSIQGETSLAGLPTTFIRLAACNLRCSWCDTTYSFGRGVSYTLESIFSKVASFGCQYVCVTGGEPLLQANVLPLMEQLCQAGYIVSLETGGSLSTQKVNANVRIILDIKCPGSQMSNKNLWDNLAHLRFHDQIKFVISNREDYDYAKAVCNQHQLFKKVSEILFSPVFEVLPSQTLVNWILEDQLAVRLNLQIHKFIWPPYTKGV
ncbi:MULTISPECIES: radical SAM protein [unclassified Neochlamydia]|uniref:radical SAM protein n=1 Tax=unclassified Neochlamydia TaxID=2643326 RepID=UPI00140B39B4|nr:MULTISPECIES: radical SAM protein [unclassified Neochlamydia]MBS4171591.1 7-carboxy-7-deazaguanine synthase [Neochlamydia sp. AcF95]NGY94156.1 7-carboxy-7-deazaguanine synthase [Neochlamydia sp. AcF84]